MAKRGGLGKGLAALVSESAEESGLNDTQEAGIPEQSVSVSEIHGNPNQPRTMFNQDDLDELSASIKEVGIIQPIVVRRDDKGYEIIAGERRYQAACAAGMKKVPVIVREDIDDIKSLQLALIENIQRADLNVMEEARAYRDLIDRTGMTQEELSKSVSKSRSAVANAIRLLDLPGEVQDLIYGGALTAGHARAILMAHGETARIALAEKAANEKMTVRAVEAIAPTFTGEPKAPREHKQLPSFFKSTANELGEKLKTPVKIKESKGKYRIEIEFADEAELRRLLEIMHGE